MAWNYERIDENGRLKSYYGRFQAWKYSDKHGEHVIRVEYFNANEFGVQYYLITIDGKLSDKPMSAARLHYFLHTHNAVEVKKALVYYPLPLQFYEVEKYFLENLSKKVNCPWCGGTGIDSGKICNCAKRFEYEIKKYNAEQRIKEALTI